MKHQMTFEKCLLVCNREQFSNITFITAFRIIHLLQRYQSKLYNVQYIKEFKFIVYPISFRMSLAASVHQGETTANSFTQALYLGEWDSGLHSGFTSLCCGCVVVQITFQMPDQVGLRSAKPRCNWNTSVFLSRNLNPREEQKSGLFAFLVLALVPSPGVMTFQ